MQLSLLLHAMSKRSAQQALLRSGQPMRLLQNNAWTSGQTAPSPPVLDAMLLDAAPKDVANLLETRAPFCEFDATSSGEAFRVQVETKHERTVVITALDEAGNPRAALRRAPTSALPAAPTTVRSAPTSSSNGASMPPALPKALEWFYARETQQIGPISQIGIEQLARTGALQPATLVWHDGMPDWMPARDTVLERVFASAPSLAPSAMLGAPQPGFGAPPTPDLNNSGMGDLVKAPPELRGWNSAAFLLPVFWCAANNLWGWMAGALVAQLAIIILPFFKLGLLASIGLCCFLGANGNELAWQHRRWESVEQFRHVQEIWRKALLYALLAIIAFCALVAASGVLR